MLGGMQALGFIDKGMDFAFSQLGNELNSSRDYRYWSRMQDRMTEDQRKLHNQSLLNDPSLQVAGMEAAGINPVAAIGNGFSLNSSPATIPNAPAMTHALADNSQSRMLEAFMMSAQIDNLEAQTNKLNAEANNLDASAENTATDTRLKEKQIFNTMSDTKLKKIAFRERDLEFMHKTTIDAETDRMLRGFYKDMATKTDDPDVKAMLMQSAENAQGYNMGNVIAFRDFNSLMTQLSDSDRKKMENLLAQKIAQGQIDDKGVFKSLVDKPVAELELLIQSAENQAQSAKYTDQLRDVDDKLKRSETQLNYHKDFVGMVKAGDWEGAIAYLAPDLIRMFGDIMTLRTLFKGRAAGKAVETLSEAGKSSKPSDPKAVKKAQAQAMDAAARKKRIDDAWQQVHEKYPNAPLHIKERYVEQLLNKK